MHGHLGIGRPTISDWPATQAGISYGRMPSALAMYEQMRAMGVTHFVWKSQTWPDSSMSADLRFYDFVKTYTEPKAVEDMFVGRMPDTPPPQPSEEELVAFFGCNDSYRAGLYPFSEWPYRIHAASPSHPIPSRARNFRAAPMSKRRRPERSSWWSTPSASSRHRRGWTRTSSRSTSVVTTRFTAAKPTSGID